MSESGTPIFSPARPRRVFEEIISQIRESIDAGHLKKGDKLPPERDLAVQFQVSRNTVREALRILEIGGSITLKRGPRGGAFVSQTDTAALNDHLTGALRLSDFSIRDLTDAMRALSTMMILEAGDRLDDDVLDQMDATVDEAESIHDDPARRSSILIRFYGQLADATGNRVLSVLADVMAELLQSWVLRLGPLGGDAIVLSRRRIIQKLRERDRAGALTELEAYLDKLHDLWMRDQR